eukprot:3901954-Rhodomonas_salina.2
MTAVFGVRVRGFCWCICSNSIWVRSSSKVTSKVTYAGEVPSPTHTRSTIGISAPSLAPPGVVLSQSTSRTLRASSSVFEMGPPPSSCARLVVGLVA